MTPPNFADSYLAPALKEAMLMLQASKRYNDRNVGKAIILITAAEPTDKKAASKEVNFDIIQIQIIVHHHWVKSVRIQCQKSVRKFFSGLYFTLMGLKSEIYRENMYEKIWTRKNSEFGRFSYVCVFLWILQNF